MIMWGIMKISWPIGHCICYRFARSVRRSSRTNEGLSTSGLEQSIDHFSSSANTEKTQQIDSSKILKAERFQEIDIKQDTLSEDEQYSSDEQREHSLDGQPTRTRLSQQQFRERAILEFFDLLAKKK